MISRQPDKTFADYVGIAISPVLIMALIGSLMFFLLEISYAGEYLGRLRWTIFWFVLASVLISRISIEQGSTHAGIYGFGLALATGLMTSRFVNFLLPVWCFLGLVWWCASKLTWDWTLIDEEEDASGEGLLQVAKLDDESGATQEKRSAQGTSVPAIPFWRQLFKNRSERAGQPHAPGLWVVYFSLIALPLFGAGQLFLPQDNPAKRRAGFVLLWIYIAAALGLLLTTSFLGLRRYLRQRRLRMAPELARAWVGYGAVLAGAILLGCLLLPRPEAKYSLTAVLGRLGSPEGAASEYSWFRRDMDSGADGGGADFLKGGDPQERDVQAKGHTDRGSVLPKVSRSGSSSSSEPSSGFAPFASRLATLLRWIIYALIAFWVLRSLIRNGSRLIKAARELVQDFFAFLRRLLGLKTPAARANAAEATGGRRPVKARPFRGFADPFASGEAQRMSAAELICYSFEALQACARECGVPRRPEQTPLEFGSVLSRAIPELESGAPILRQFYTRLAYSGRLPAEGCLENLEHLWRQMTSVTGQLRRELHR